jgi:hypothetical protein
MDSLDWVCEQGVVLQSARGPLPNLVEHIAEVPFPDWIPAEDVAAAALLTVEEALALLPRCLRGSRAGPVGPSAPHQPVSGPPAE